MIELGTITKADIKDVWDDEKAFSSWLASDGLTFLGKTLGLTLSDAETEVTVGRYSADVVCEVRSDGQHPVNMVIENQFGKSDHDHLGKVLTYAAGLGKSDPVFKQVVRHVVWIAEDFNDEHRVAVDWLNENTGAEIGLFALAIECKSINNSVAAPELRVLSKPDGLEGSDISAPQELNRKFWLLVNGRLQNVFKPKPGKGQTLFFGALRKNFRLRGNYVRNRLQVALNIDGPNAFDYAKMLETESDDIEEMIGAEVAWKFRENGRTNLVLLDRPGSVHEAVSAPDGSDSSELAGWMASNLELFREVFTERVQNLQLPDNDPDDDGS